MKITLTRNSEIFYISNQSIGTDAYNALQSLPNITELMIIEETDDQVTLCFALPSNQVFNEINAYISKYGLKIHSSIK